MASLTERQARVLAREQAAAEKAKAAFDAMSPERKARIKAAEKAKADAAAAAAAKRAARKKEPKLIVDPPRGEDTTYFPNLDLKVPNSELGKPISKMPVDEFGQSAQMRNKGGIMYPTVNPVYNTYGM